MTVAVSGDFGKPRPAVIVQSDAISEDHASVIVCQITSELAELPALRITLDPTTANGLRVRSQIMADKPTTIRKGRIGRKIGQLDPSDLARVNSALSLALGLLD